MKFLRHQTDALVLAREKPRYLFQWACGAGKTIAALAICADQPMKTLVVCPKSVMRTAWCEDAKHFSLNVKCLWAQSRRKRFDLIRSDWDVGVCNFDFFRVNVNELAAIGVQRLIIDESSFVRNPKAKLTIAAMKFADRMKSVYLLSASPSPKDGSGYWSQLRMIDPGNWSPSFWGFVNRYLVPIKKKFGGKEIIAGWRWNSLNKPDFDARLKAVCWSLTKEECVDLPGQVNQVLEVELGDEELAAYIAAEKELRLLSNDGEWKRIKQEATLTKCRQLTGGACLVDGVPTMFGDAKLRTLIEKVNEIGAPVVVWAEFRHSIDRVARSLEAEGLRVGVIDGRTSDDAALTVAMFADGRMDVVVAHPAAAGHGTNGLQKKASYAIFYELSFDSDKHHQARDRIHRIGMGDRPATYIYLLCPKTVDQAMYRVVMHRMSEQAAMAELLKRDTGKKVEESFTFALDN